ncbi:hypothetical protein [Microbacterium sp. P05]|uniref:hypothetical protein n=1 Tax=Microbacterium sp. P05 TaxID=3366948 RepID=UPI00374753DF
MMTSPPRSDRALTRLVAFAVAAIAVGASLLLLALVLDWEGFWGGAVMGAGIAVGIVGAYFWGYANGLRRSGGRTVWLPSDDIRA